MNYHDKEIKTVSEILKTNHEVGLNELDAKSRLKTHGENKIVSRQHDSILKKFFTQFNDFMVIILLIAAVISFFIGHDAADSIIILIIIMTNALIGLVQEIKAEKSIESLKKLTVPTAKVLRDNIIKNISSEEIVPGDVLIIETGDFIAADARLISAINLKLDEATLTGESLPVEKQCDVLISNTLLAERTNMVYCGSYVSYGRGKAVVVSTGMNTEVGKIANLIMEEQSETPLQKKLDNTGKILATGALIICCVIFVMGLMRNISLFEIFMTSVSLAVAAIPEGLPAIVTIVLAIGVQRMAKHNAIIKKLPAVETLGSANVICSDKTGTLTQNHMKVVETKTYSQNQTELIKLACLCNNAKLNCNNAKPNEKSKGNIGLPTELALLAAGIEFGFDKMKLDRQFPRIFELPFDSKRKLMTTIHNVDNKQLVITKGAPDVLLQCCKYFGDETQELNLNLKRRIVNDNTDMASRALRVIALAYKTSHERTEDNLIFLGLIGMIDPPRDEVYDAVQKCITAGIKPVMITGDHVLTAQSIARKLGIMRDNDKSITGMELQNTSDDELCKNIFKYSVFARVSPEHKVKIVKAFQNRNCIVAMTGDGVNDAPALKTADIGCAMGISGTDVAKSAADMILTDDNFSTIVEAVREGRNIFSNIKKSIHFLLSSNIGEIVTIFMAILFGWQTPLLAIQLLWVNLVTDSFPAIALGLEPSETDIMSQKPNANANGFFNRDLWTRIVVEGMMIGLLSLIAYGLGNLYYGLDTARTMAFATLSISQLVHAFNMRSEKSIFSGDLLSNPYIILSFIVCLILQAAVIMCKPLSIIFHVTILSSIQWLMIVFLSLIPIVIVELEKYVLRKPF